MIVTYKSITWSQGAEVLWKGAQSTFLDKKKIKLI